MKFWASFSAISFLLTSGCMDALLQARAQRDLACSDVQITGTWAGEYEASGCGDTVDYACINDRGGATCIREGNLDTVRPVVVITPPTPSKAGAVSAEPGFPLEAAVSSMKLAASYASDCAAIAGPRGQGTAEVTFEKDGHVSSVVLSAPFEGTPVGECVAGKFRRVTIPAFADGPKPTKKTFELAGPFEA